MWDCKRILGIQQASIITFHKKTGAFLLEAPFLLYNKKNIDKKSPESKLFTSIALKNILTNKILYYKMQYKSNQVL